MIDEGYLCGPMAGYDEANYPVFDYWAGILRDRGRRVFSPSQVEHPPGLEGPALFAALIAIDLSYISSKDCEGLWVIPGWQHSKGGKIEIATALACKKPILDVVSEEGIGVSIEMFVRCEHRRVNENFYPWDYMIDTRTHGPARDREMIQTPKHPCTVCLDCGQYPVFDRREHFPGIE